MQNEIMFAKNFMARLFSPLYFSIFPKLKSLDSCHSLKNISFSSPYYLPAEPQFCLPYLSKPFSVYNFNQASGFFSHQHSLLLSCSSHSGWVPYDVRCFDERKGSSCSAITAAFEHVWV